MPSLNRGSLSLGFKVLTDIVFILNLDHHPAHVFTNQLRPLITYLFRYVALQYSYKPHRLAMQYHLACLVCMVSQGRGGLCTYYGSHWCRVTHICVSITNQHTNIGLSPVRREAIIWNNAAILLVGSFGTYFHQIYHLNFTGFHSMKRNWKCCLRNGGHFVLASMC